MPEADSELNSMTETLGGLMVDSLSNDTFAMESSVVNEEDRCNITRSICGCGTTNR